jgi:hypothetical protein
MRKENLRAAACLVAIPLSIWIFDLANRGLFPSDIMVRLFGREERHGSITSLPDYWEWDIGAMLVAIAVGGAAVIYLLRRIMKRYPYPRTK